METKIKMPKLNSIKTASTPALMTGKLSLTTKAENNRITSFEVRYAGKIKEFPVRGKFNILEAWRKTEEWIKTL